MIRFNRTVVLSLRLEVTKQDHKQLMEFVHTYNRIKNELSREADARLEPKFNVIAKYLGFEYVRRFPTVSKMAMKMIMTTLARANLMHLIRISRLKKAINYNDEHSLFANKRKIRKLKKLKAIRYLRFRSEASVVFSTGDFYVKPDSKVMGLRLGQQWLSMPYVYQGKMHEDLFDEWRRRSLLLSYSDRKGWVAKLYSRKPAEIPGYDCLKREEILGVDLGFKNAIATSFGTIVPAAPIRKRYAHLCEVRRSVERKNTKSARRKLLKMQYHAVNFLESEYYRLATLVVKEAQEHKCKAIVLEDLSNLPNSNTFIRYPKDEDKWDFRKLVFDIETVALNAGIPTYIINPSCTSRQCPICGFTKKSNRVSQSWFSCSRCGYNGNADATAALNIRNRLFDMPPRKRGLVRCAFIPKVDIQQDTGRCPYGRMR